MKVAQIPTDTLGEILDGIVRLLPNLLAAAGLLVAGWVAGRILKALTVRLLGVWGTRIAGGMGRLLRSRDVERRVRTGTSRPVADAVGRIVFWLTFLLFLAAATEVLGLPVISTWISGIAGYLPSVMAAALIILLGILAGNLARNAAASAASRAGVLVE
ncbi:MAG: mechanosensitive ion channel family protein [Actinomycetota bacterium]